MRSLTLSLSIALVLAAAQGLRAEDWPEFRGPTGQGHVRSGSLPVVWNSQKNVAWKQAIPGSGWSSPIIGEGKIYLTTAVPVLGSDSGDQSLQALCLDAPTGKILWQKEVFHQDGATSPAIHGKNSHASSTPLIAGKRLYMHFGHQGTACLDLAGNVLWQNRGLRYAPVHGNGGSPILVDDSLIFSCDGGDRAFIAALNASTGRLRWKTDRSVDAFKRFSFSTPLLITVHGQKQVISPASNAVYAYEPHTGREIWRVRHDGYSVIPRPVFGDGLLFVCTGYESPSLMAIRPDGQGDVTESHIAWTVNRGVPHAPCPVLVGAELYMVSDNGLASCLDAKTGEILWQQRLGGSYSASPIDTDGKIYFLNEQGASVVIEAGRQFHKLATNAIQERTLASYAAADGALFIRTAKNLYRIEQK